MTIEELRFDLVSKMKEIEEIQKNIQVLEH